MNIDLFTFYLYEKDPKTLTFKHDIHYWLAPLERNGVQRSLKEIR